MSRAVPPPPAPPPRPTPPSPTQPDRSKLRAGFMGLLKAIWFLLALVIYLIGFLLHIVGIGLIRVSGLGGGSQQLAELPQPTTLSRSPGYGAPAPPRNPGA